MCVCSVNIAGVDSVEFIFRGLHLFLTYILETICTTTTISKAMAHKSNKLLIIIIHFFYVSMLMFVE